MPSVSRESTELEGYMYTFNFECPSGTALFAPATRGPVRPLQCRSLMVRSCSTRHASHETNGACAQPTLAAWQRRTQCSTGELARFRCTREAAPDLPSCSVKASGTLPNRCFGGSRGVAQLRLEAVSEVAIGCRRVAHSDVAPQVACRAYQ